MDYYFAKNVEKLRLLAGMTLSELEVKLGLSKGYVSKLLGANKLPSLELALKIAEFFGVSVDVILRTNLDMMSEASLKVLSLCQKLIEQTNMGRREWTKVEPKLMTMACGIMTNHGFERSAEVRTNGFEYRTMFMNGSEIGLCPFYYKDGNPGGTGYELFIANPDGSYEPLVASDFSDYHLHESLSGLYAMVNAGFGCFQTPKGVLQKVDDFLSVEGKR